MENDFVSFEDLTAQSRSLLTEHRSLRQNAPVPATLDQRNAERVEERRRANAQIAASTVHNHMHAGGNLLACRQRITRNDEEHHTDPPFGHGEWRLAGRGANAQARTRGGLLVPNHPRGSVSGASRRDRQNPVISSAPRMIQGGIASFLELSSG
jgi:hypothetical protein